MAGGTGLPSDIYSGGAANFNAEPFVAFQTNLLAHEAAKNEALDKSYRDLNNGLTPAGMKANDIPGFMQKLNTFQNYYTQNTDNVKDPRKDNGAAQSQYHSMYNDLLGDIQKSKDAVNDLHTIQAARLGGKWNATTNDLNVASNIGASIYDKSSLKNDGSRYSANDLSLNVPDFDSKAQTEFSNAVYGGNNLIKPVKTYDVTKATTDKATGLVTVPYTIAYTPDQIKQIGRNAANVVGGVNSPSYISYERKLSDPNFNTPALNATYQQVHGKDAVVDTPQKLAEADFLMGSSAYKEQGTEVPKDNAVYMEALKNQNAIKLKQTEGADSNGLWTVAALQQATLNAINNPQNGRDYIKADGTKSKEYELPTNPIILKSVGGADALYYNPDTKMYRPVFYQRQTEDAQDGSYKKGDIIQGAISNSHVVNPMTEQDVIESMAGKTVGKKFLAPEIQSGLKNNQQSQPVKTTIKNSDIPTKASAAGYSVKEYTSLLNKKGIKITN